MSNMKFCRECNNLLYPKGDNKRKILLYVCHHCDHQEVADNNCVYRRVVNHAAEEPNETLQIMPSDPTLPRTRDVRCAQCNHDEAVFFRTTNKREEGMSQFFVCCNSRCGHRWRD